MQYDETTLWNAVAACDGAYDGKFFYAVQTVGVYCRPSCKSRTPLPKNVRYFESGAQAEQAGFRPCKRCRPDLLDYAPMAALAQQTRALIDRDWQERARLNAGLKRLGASANHLAAVFKRQYGVTPAQYRSRLRAEQAGRLLTETDMPIVDVAAEVGFAGLPGFYSFFKKHAGVTPREYRAARRQKEA